jgi:hypothetical protein
MYNNKYRIGMWTIRALCLVIVLVLGSCRADDHNMTSVGIDEVTVTGNGPVLHVVGQKTATGGEGDTDREEVHELWYDEQSGDTSHEVRNSEGKLVRKKIVQGRIIEDFNAETGSHGRVTAPSLDAPMRHAGEELLLYKSWHSRSQADPQAVATAGLNSRRVLVDGQPRVEFEGAALERLGVDLVQVDPTTNLPLRTRSMIQNGAISEVHWVYTTVERLSVIPDEAFSIDDDGEIALESKYLNHEDARVFPDYPIYYLGETYDEIPTFGRKSVDYGNGKRFFQVLYTEPIAAGVQKRKGKGKVTVETRPVAEVGEGKPILGADRAVVTIDGEDVERREDLERAQGSGPIELQIGASRVRLFGIKDEDLSTAVASLRRLNDLAPTIDSGNR